MLYESSEDALAVLLENPDLIAQAKELIYANIDVVDEVILGPKGVIYNIDEIADIYNKNQVSRTFPIL